MPAYTLAPEFITTFVIFLACLAGVGALAWLDCWAVPKGARNKRLAEAWIDYTLEKPVSAILTERQGLANTLAGGAVESNHRLVWLRPVEDAPRRAALWNRILSGDPPGKFR